jgi:hypothetical protein
MRAVTSSSIAHALFTAVLAAGMASGCAGGRLSSDEARKQIAGIG